MKFLVTIEEASESAAPLLVWIVGAIFAIWIMGEIITAICQVLAVIIPMLLIAGAIWLVGMVVAAFSS